jgi:predicted permease
MTIWGLFLLILPVFALIGVGVALRRGGVVEQASEASIIRLVVFVCMPCLAFDTIVANPSLRIPQNLILPPLAGFVTTATGFGFAYAVGRLIGLEKGAGLRTFAFSAGVVNYSYLPFPILGRLGGERAQGVMLVHNMGVELAIWSVGILVLTGGPFRQGLRRLVSPMLGAIVFAVALNLLNLGGYVPGLVRNLIHALGAIAIPLGLLMTGMNLANFLDQPSKLLHPRVALTACAVRLAILPLLMLAFARVLPASVDLKRVLVVEASMPAGVIPIIIAQYYGGRHFIKCSRTAFYIILMSLA